MGEISATVETAWRAVQSAGIIIGGVWVYMLFIRECNMWNKIRQKLQKRERVTVPVTSRNSPRHRNLFSQLIMSEPSPKC